METNFRAAAEAALTAPATAMQGAMIAEHPITGIWTYFLGGTPAHDIKHGYIVKWAALAEHDYQYVFITQQQAAAVQSGEDDNGNEIDLELEIDQLELEIIEEDMASVAMNAETDA